MNYLSAIAYLESYKSRGIKLGLDRVERLLHELGDPQDKFISIHIAGTNGKGSVAAMLSSILTTAGYRTGLYTSPHLVDYTERVRINERDISKDKFASSVLQVKKTIEKLRGLKLTEFEVLTAVCFLMMAKEKVEVAVIEVGLGGRFDATNVITPVISIITNIGLDHTDLLGKDLRSIAGEKGGIIKSGIPLVTGEKKVLNLFKKICDMYGSVLIRSNSHKGFKAPLIGKHQIENMNTALTAIDVLRDRGFRMNDRQIIAGLRCTRWPGRLQIVSKRPLIIIDGAHNLPGARTLAAYLQEHKKKFDFIIGMQSNKDIKSFIRTIRPVANRFIVTRSTNPLSAKESEVARFCGRSAYCARNLKDALKLASRSKLPICIAGSLYLIGDILRQKVFDCKGSFLYNSEQ